MPRKQITYSSHPTHRARMVHAQGERQFRTYDTSHIRPQKSKAPMVVAGILAVIVIVVAVLGISTALRGCSSAEPVDGTQVATQADVEVTIPDGATAQDVALLRQHTAPQVKVKAAGGIATKEDAEAFLALGADRLGTSRLVKLAKEAGL